MAIHGIKILKGVSKCAKCGKRIWKQGYAPESHIAYLMARDKVCHECAYWMDLIEYPPEYMEVLGNKCVRLHPVADKKDKSLLLGGKGKLRYFMRKDESLIESNDVWTIGTIPERFKDALPTTISEITFKAFRQLSWVTKKCKARGCLDRYNCYRYNLDVEKDTGPFNPIPPKWKVGDEHCRFFLNIKDIGIDKSSESNTTENGR